MAVRGLGKYRLAPGYTSFSVDPTLWSKWSDQRKEQHMKRYFEYVAKPSEIYQKPANAGKKGNSFEVKRRSTQPEAEIFIDRVNKDTVTPIKLTKTNKETGEWEVEGYSMELDPLNTESCTPSYVLVEKGSKDCPKRVKRCEMCRFEFNGTDKYVVKTAGVREFTGKSGRIERHQGNVYLHFLTTCLTKFDKTFHCSLLKIPKRTPTEYQKRRYR